MSKEDAIRAYRDSLYDAADLDLKRRIGGREAIFGGIGPGLGQLGNALWRPFKVGGALMFGYGGEPDRKFPQMPEVPKEFKDSTLGKDFAASWKLKQEAADAQVEGVSKLLNFDINGWWKNANIAAHAEHKDMRVLFPEEGAAEDAMIGGAAGGGFAEGLSRGDSGQGRSR